MRMMKAITETPGGMCMETNTNNGHKGAPKLFSFNISTSEIS